MDYRNNPYPPDSPEAVAFALMHEILKREESNAAEKSDRRSNQRPRDELLDLYAECLAATRGDRARLGNGATVLH